MILPENECSHLKGLSNQPYLNICAFDQKIFIFQYLTLRFTQLRFLHSSNRPFPSCILSLCQNKSKCELTIHMICTYRFISRLPNSSCIYMKDFIRRLLLKQRHKDTFIHELLTGAFDYKDTVV